MLVLNPIDVKVGECLQNTRLHLGLSFHELALAIGVSNACLLDFESGKTRIGADKLYDICRVLHVRPVAFFAWLPDKANATPKERDAA
ncbi:hypothetical protein CCR94_16075 [Rhodoblastus sphagnicola]|uniref:HTH cro/C1-type domain-containing protein n=1 Tax=Rhodoblastus sphagnicola TaxID=333368 RepID=A0A2S6N3G3_9HYPH|nr:hypothetical protein CCR94_16075 [Rhodoblastus sphagnicola]